MYVHIARDYLYGVEAGGAVVAADRVEEAVHGADLMCGAAAVHVRNGLPSVAPRVEALPRC